MADVAVTPSHQWVPASGGYLLTIAGRNLWRNKRRTFLTAGGIAFAILLVNFAISVQTGSYGQMIDTATSLFVGHIQIQSSEYVDNQRFRHTLDNPAELVSLIEEASLVTAVTARVEAFALVSVDEHSFGAQIIGVDPVREPRVSRVLSTLIEGNGLDGPDGAIVGTALARNLNAKVGDEVVVLGSGKDGGVAAIALTINGLFQTGQLEIDRGLLIAPLATVQDGFNLNEAAHTIVVQAKSRHDVPEAVRQIRSLLPESDDDRLVRPWTAILPEVQQAIEVDRISGRIFYWLIMGLVAFSVVNTFIMTIFERTKEFGVLLAIGMRARQIFMMLIAEAAFMWLVGAVVGIAIASAVTAWLAAVGIPLGDMAEYGQGMYIPSRIFAEFSVAGVLTAPAVLLVGTLIAAIIPGTRLFRLRPVEALRET